MAQALGLARQGVARTHPNPMVGAVLVKHGRKIGEVCTFTTGGITPKS